MADNLSIIIQALLEKASTESIKKQIDDLQSYADTKKIHLSLDINNSEFKSFVANLEKISTNMSKALSINADTSGLNKVAVTMNTTNKEMAFMEKRVKETTNAMGQLVKETSKFKQEANAAGDPVLTLTKRTEETVSNFEKQRKEQQKALEAQEKLEQERYIRSWTAKIKEIEDRNKLQLKVDKETEKQEQERYVRSWVAKIKEVEERNKQTQKNLTDLTNFQQKMLGGDGFKGDLDIFEKKQKGRFDTSALEKIRDDVKALNVDTPDLQQNIKRLGIQFSSLKQEASQSGSIMSRAFENLGKFLRFYLVAGSVVKLKNALLGVVDIIKQLDEALVEVNKVLDLSSSQLQKLSVEATNLGIAYGKNSVEVINSIGAFAKAGLDETVSKQFAELAMLLSNVGDISVETAQKTLIMANAGYQLGNDYETLNTLISQFNELANKNAVDVQFLSDAWQNSASIARQAKFSIEDYNAVLTVAGSISQKSGAEVGNALRTWMMRLQGVTDGTDTLEEDISKVDKVLSELGIELRKSPTQFKPIMENLDAVAKKYRELGEAGETVAQAEMLEAMAGKHRANIVAGLLDNFEMINKALEDQAGAYQSAEKENAIYMDSITAKTGALKAQWELFSSNMLDSGVVKAFLDLGRILIQIADTGFGRLITTVGIATIAFNLLKIGITKLSTIVASSVVYSKFAAMINLMTGSVLGLKVGIEALTTSLLASPLFWTVAIATGITLLIKGIQYLSKETERQTEKVKGLKDEYDNLTKSLEDNEEKQKQVKDRLEELYGLRVSNEITQAEKDELTRLENVNAELQKQIDYEKALKLIRGEELERESLELSKGRTISKDDKKPLGGLRGLLKLGATDLIDPKGSSYAPTTDEKIAHDTEKLKAYRDELEKLNQARDDGSVGVEEYAKQKEELTNKISPLAQNLNTLVESLEEEAKNYNGSTIEGDARKASIEGITTATKDLIVETSNLVSGIDATIGSMDEASAVSDEMAKRQAELAKKVSETQEEFSKYGDSTKTLQTALSELSGGDLSTATLDKLVGAYKELIPYLDDRATLQEKINELIAKEQQKSYADTLKESTSTIQSLNELQDKLNKSQGISADVMNDVINKHSELAPYLSDREALENAISSAIVTQEDIQRQALTNQLAYSQKFYNEKIKGTVQAYNKIFTAYGEDINNFKNTAEAKEAIDRILVEGIGNRWAKMYTGTAASLAKTLSAMGREMGKLIVSGDYAGASSLSKQIKSLSSMVGVLRSIETQYSQTVGKINLNGINLKGIKGGSVGGSSASKAAQEIYKPIIDAYQKISTELDRINALLEENSILTEQAEGSDKIALLQKRIALIKQQENALKRLNVQQKKELQVVKNSLKGMGFNFDSNNNITNYAQRLSKLTGDTAKSAEELIDRFVELSTQAIPDTNNEILKLKNSIKSIGAEIDTYITDTFDQFYNFLFHNIDEEIKKLEESKAKAKEVAEAKIALIQAEIDQMQERNEAQKVEEERTKRLMDLAKQRDKLANVQNNRDTMLYNADGTASLVANPQKVRDETEKLMDLEEDYYKWEEDIRNQEQIKKLQDQIATLQDELKNQEKGYDDQISALQKFMEEQKDILSGANDFQIANAKALMEALAGIDSELYAGRLEALNEFVNSYNSLMGNTVSGNAKIPKITPPKTTPTPKPSTPSTPTPSPSPSPTPSSGSSSGGKVSEVKGSLKKGAKGENVKLLQQALVGLGYSLPKYGIDGSFGGETLAAVMQFQKDMGLVVDGSVGAKTKAKFKLKGYATGGINDSPGMYELHGTKRQPEAIFNTKQLNNLFKILNGIKVPQFELPAFAGAGLSGGASNVYNFSIGSVQTNDAGGFLDNLKNLANKK